MDGISLKQIISSRKTIIEMLDDRGYTLESEEESQLINDISKDIIATKGKMKIKVVYLLQQRRQVPAIKEIIAENCNESELSSDFKKSYIAVVQHKVNKTFINLATQYNFEIFNINALVRNITKHTLVPKHILLTEQDNEQEISDLKKHLSIDSFDKLPIMKTSDPIAKYYGAKSGNIFKIIRNSKTAGKYTSFRYIQED